MKILAIGNSFSIDAMEYLWDICRDGGEEVILGNLYIGGCSLDRHWTNAANDTPDYKYYKNTAGTWEITPETTLLQGILDEDWDIITMQQVSTQSGKPEFYGNLDALIAYVQTHKTNKNAKLYWHMTWAYQQDIGPERLANYGGKQQEMYRSICKTVQEVILPRKVYAGIIPSGTAVQNLRNTPIGDTVTRDGFHMSHDHGRYTAAITWYTKLLCGDPEKITWVPAEQGHLLKDLPLIRKAVKDAVYCPFEITK